MKGEGERERRRQLGREGGREAPAGGAQAREAGRAGRFARRKKEAAGRRQGTGGAGGGWPAAEAWGGGGWRAGGRVSNCRHPHGRRRRRPGMLQPAKCCAQRCSGGGWLQEGTGQGLGDVCVGVQHEQERTPTSVSSLVWSGKSSETTARVGAWADPGALGAAARRFAARHQEGLPGLGKETERPVPPVLPVTGGSECEARSPQLREKSLNFTVPEGAGVGG